MAADRRRAPRVRVRPGEPRWRAWLRRLVHLNDSPPRIAGGVAIGVFIGVAPTFGVGSLLAAGLAALFRCNPVAAVAGSFAGAPPFIFLIWLASAWLGAQLFGLEWHALYAQFKTGEVFRAGGDTFLAYLAGNAVVTSVLTAAAYWIVLAVVHRHRRRQRL